MPFNRVNNVKAMLLWLLILKTEAEGTKDGKIDANKIIKFPNLPMYYPGLMLIPIPEAGFILGRLDIAFWAAFLYLLGSILYMMDSFYMWTLFNPNYTDDALNPAIYLNTMAAGVFVLNALACILDWWLQIKQLSAMNLFIDESMTGGVLISEIPTRLSMLYFYNNVFFLAAAIVYMIQSIWMEDPRTDYFHCEEQFCGVFWINFWGSLLYLMSSLCSIGEFYENARIRKEQKLPPVKLFTWNSRDFDWFGWGDWLFLATSVVAMLQVIVTTFIDQRPDTLQALYFLENVLFLVDSLAYFIGYLLYMYELRQALVTGYVPTSHTGAINELIGDCGTPPTETEVEYVPAPPVVDIRTPLCHSHAVTQPMVVTYPQNDDKVTLGEIKYRLSEARRKRIQKRRNGSFADDVENPLLDPRKSANTRPS